MKKKWKYFRKILWTLNVILALARSKNAKDNDLSAKGLSSISIKKWHKWCLFIEFTMNSDWLESWHNLSHDQSHLVTWQPILTTWEIVFYHCRPVHYVGSEHSFHTVHYVECKWCFPKKIYFTHSYS
jgi:hypothetical protein